MNCRKKTEQQNLEYSSAKRRIRRSVSVASQSVIQPSEDPQEDANNSLICYLIALESSGDLPPDVTESLDEITRRI